MITFYIVRHILKWVIGVFLLSTLFFVVLYKFIPVPVTPLMVIRCMQQVGRGETIRMKHHWEPMERISPYMSVAVRASEDQRFLNHHGFDFTEIGNAVDKKMHGGRLRGGSTISQQTAKNVFLWPESSWTRKAFEVYFTAMIELVWSKERIMEVYLNSIEMGDGIYGAEAVAQQHFHCSAEELTRAQCAMIAATLPNPLRFNSAQPSRYMMQRQYSIMRQMRHIDFLTPKKDEAKKD